jgi:hypothetical protein
MMPSAIIQWNSFAPSPQLLDVLRNATLASR